MRLALDTNVMAYAESLSRVPADDNKCATALRLIANARDEIADLLADNPSLKAVLADVTASAYRYERRKAAVETDLAEDAFPSHCPWSFAEATDEGFWPD